MRRWIQPRRPEKVYRRGPSTPSQPAGRTHFSETRDEPVAVLITGFGPSATQYVDPKSDPLQTGLHM
jgi:hypothetical protein